MGELLLDSLKIENFRCFDHLEIKKLGRVNLIIGKNGVGKTALLEALRLYSSKYPLQTIETFLRERDELTNHLNGSLGSSSGLYPTINNLFYGRPDIHQPNNPVIRIGEINKPQSAFELTVIWELRIPDKNGYPRYSKIPADDFYLVGNKDPFLEISIGGKLQIHTDLDIEAKFLPLQAERFNLVYIYPNGFTDVPLSTMWEAVLLSRSRPLIVEALQLIADTRDFKVEDVDFTPKKVPILGLAGENSALPLKSFGDGFNHLFTLALALVNARNGWLLADEIDTGLHFSTFQETWKFIFKMANQYNVQVFATTHSKDCLDSFMNTAIEAKADAKLLRLQKKRGKLFAVDFDREGIEVLADTTIEVR
jgi:ABC-type branched-subunit amino acid transport system ATPase component